MAGVSTATVSRVINQTAWVEPVTRERVEKAMRDLNYRRNAAAIALAKRSGDMLGLLTGNLADPFFARLARGVEDVSRKQQYRLMVCSGGHDEEMEKAGLDFLVNQGCEAIVVHASRLPDKELLRYAAHFPALVVVNRYIAGMANRCIWLENRSAAREATRYLLANGHRRIACVTSDLPIIDRQERLDGYREALEEYGISPDPRWVISVPFNEEGGERAAHQLINSGLPLTAAVTFNDVMAAGIMRILHQRGVQLPQQLSIVGFDGPVSLSGVNNNALSGRTNGALCRATGDTVIPGHYAAAQQQSFQCRTGDPRFCRALFFTVNASSTVKTVMAIKLTLLM